MAKENSIIKKVIGIEYSQTAVDDARKRANQLEEDVQSRLQIQRGDLFTFFKEFDKNSLDGIYANSVFHFLTPLQRKDLYQECYQLLKSDGIIGVSFKFQGDALFKRGEIIEKTDAGTIIRDSNDNITRLFVSPSGVDVLANEIELAGFEISAIIRWSVPNYNIDGDQGLFVGFLGKHK
jgi:SAM-dependent methyltransferase